MTDDQRIVIESGQLALGIVRYMPSRWHPILRWRQQRRRRRAGNRYEMFLEAFEGGIVIGPLPPGRGGIRLVDRSRDPNVT